MLDFKKQNKDYKFINFQDDLEILFPEMIEEACSKKVNFLFDNYYQKGDQVWIALSLKDSSITFLDKSAILAKNFESDNIVITKIKKAEDVFENYENCSGSNTVIIKKETLKSILNLEFKSSSKQEYGVGKLIYKFLDNRSKLCYELKLGELSINYFHFNFFKNNKILSNYFLKFLENQFEKFKLSNNIEKVNFIHSAWIEPLITESNKNYLSKLLIDSLTIYKENRIFRIYEWTSFYNIYFNLKDPALTEEFLKLLIGMEADLESFIVSEKCDSNMHKSFKKEILKLLNENKISLSKTFKIEIIHPIIRSDEEFVQFCNLLKSIKNNLTIEINLIDAFRIGVGQDEDNILKKLQILKQLENKIDNLSFKNLDKAITITEIKKELSIQLQ